MLIGIIYYLFAFITGYIVRVGSASDLTKKIKDGTMQIMLIRPTHPVLAIFSGEVASGFRFY